MDTLIFDLFISKAVGYEKIKIMKLLLNEPNKMSRSMI